MSAKEKDAPASVLVLRELLRTPLVQDLLRDSMRQDADAAPALTRALLADDPQLALDLAAALPARVNAAGEAAAELAAALNGFPTTLTREAAQQWAGELDTAALEQQLGSLLAALWRHLWEDPRSRQALLAALVKQVDAGVERLAHQLEQDPEAIAGPAEELVGALLDGVDLGRLRRVHALGLQAAAGPTSRIIARAMGDPVLVANLAAALPPLVNAQLRALADAVEALDLPAEVLASALFNLLQALDPGQAARLLNGLARTITEAHRGNLILGRHEPRFRAVCADLLEDLLPRLDGERLELAALALAEDLDTLLTAWEDLAERRPELAPERLVAALGRAGAPLWPRARAAAARMIPARAGELAGALVGGFVDAVEKDPGLVGRTLSQAVERTEPERLERAITRSLEQAGEVFIARPELLEAVTGPVIAALQGLVMQYMRALGERLRGQAREKDAAGGETPPPRKKSAPRRLVGRIMGRGKKRGGR